MKTALICGISGQDGAYLARLLLGKGYRVIGTSRDAALSSFVGLERLGIRESVELRSMSLTDFRSTLSTISETRPDEIYNLAGQSSVSLSFAQPAETLESIAFATLNLLETIRFLGVPVRLYNAASSECFGNIARDSPANESSAFQPRSPYGVAKCAAFWEVRNYREAYGLFACSGILSNHESPLRPARFVTRKIISSAHRISEGSRERLTLGNLAVSRDWGYAPEFVEAMWLMLQASVPADYVIATGETTTLEDFVLAAFEEFGLDWRDHVTVEESLFRASDIDRTILDPSLAAAELGWRASTKFRELVRILAVQDALESPRPGNLQRQ